MEKITNNSLTQKKGFIALSKDKIVSLLTLPKKITLDTFLKIESTSDFLKKHPKDIENIHVCLAEMQTHGRGRFNRNWHSPFGKNIYLSLRYTAEAIVGDMSGLSLVMPLAICDAIESVSGLQGKLSIKWPNDIFFGGSKLSGILIETQREASGLCHLIIGVGVNVNLDKMQPLIDQSWTSILKETGKSLDRNLLAATIINNIVRYADIFFEKGLQYFKWRWESRDYFNGKIITITMGRENFTGRYVGINDKGHIGIEQDDKTLFFSSGDARVKKQNY